jgi:hypothetical protein
MLTDSVAKSGALKPGVSPYFVLAAVAVRDTSRRPLAEKLFELKKKHFGADVGNRNWGDTEIKGRYLFRASRSVATGNVLSYPSGYASLKTPSQVDALVKDLGLIFSTFRPQVFAAVVDKVEMLATGKDLHPIGIAYTYLHQRIALAMENLYAGDAAMIVADQQTQHEKFFRQGGMQDTRVALGNGLYRKPNYDLVLDKPLWVDTDLSSWDREIIQLADIVAYAVGELMKRRAVPSEYNYLWPQISSCMALHFRTGKPLGSGLSIFPKSAKAPQI